MRYHELLPALASLCFASEPQSPMPEEDPMDDCMILQELKENANRDLERKALAFQNRLADTEGQTSSPRYSSIKPAAHGRMEQQRSVQARTSQKQLDVPIGAGYAQIQTDIPDPVYSRDPWGYGFLLEILTRSEQAADERARERIRRNQQAAEERAREHREKIATAMEMHMARLQERMRDSCCLRSKDTINDPASERQPSAIERLVEKTSDQTCYGHLGVNGPYILSLHPLIEAPETSSNQSLPPPSSPCRNCRGYVHDPYVDQSILRVVELAHETTDHYKSSHHPSFEKFLQRTKSVERRVLDSWKQWNRLDDILGFGAPNRQKGRDLPDASAYSDTMLNRCQNVAENVLQYGRMLAGNLSSRALLPLCFLGTTPSVSGAPMSPGDAISKATVDIDSLMSSLGSMANTLAPYAFVVAGLTRVACILSRPTRGRGHPKYFGTLSFITAFGWWAVRVAQEELDKEATLLAAFFACYASFVADSRRNVKEKEQYLLPVVSSAVIFCLLFTALQPFDSTHDQFAPRVTAEPSVLRSEEAAVYLTRAADNAPFWFAASASVFYILKKLNESTPQEHAAHE